MGQSAAHKKNKLLKAQNFKTFKMFRCNTQDTLFCLTQAVILSSTSNFVTTIATH